MEQMISICDLVGQVIQKKEEEKRIAEEQAAKDRYWKIPICYDDDEDDTIGITPVLQIKEPNNSLSDNIDYVDASPPDVEIVSLEVVEIIVPEVGRIDDDILLTIKDDTLHERLLNVNLLIAKIDALRDNPTPSSDVVIKSTSTFSNLFLERRLVVVPTTHVDFSQYDSFIFDLSNDQFPLADRSDLYHEEFADELAHIMSLPNLECFNH
ncbi:hypothetical protein Tco_0915440 [Tanacetum coccineum]